MPISGPFTVEVKKQWYCLSGDTKPASADVAGGDRCTETDTGNNFVYSGSAWIAETSDAVTISGTPPNTAAGVNSHGSIDASSSVVAAAGLYKRQMMITNTHASQTLYLSFSNPATANDFPLLAGASENLNFGPTNTLYGLGSGVGTTFSAMGA